jgi:hypothetical protein
MDEFNGKIKAYKLEHEYNSDLKKWVPPNTASFKYDVAICQSSIKSEYQKMINAEIPCSAIYSIDYEDGTLYALKLSRKMTHKHLSERLDNVDRALGATGSPETSRFKSISMDEFNGKIKPFRRGEHGGDIHFKSIFKTEHSGGGNQLPDSGVLLFNHSFIALSR